MKRNAFFLLWSVLLEVASGCEVIGCHCWAGEAETRVNCSSRRLTQFPYISLPPTTTHLDVSNNQFKHISLELYSLIPEVEFLSLRNVSLASLPTSLIGGLSHLRHLDLSSNQISSYDNTPFRDLESLESLILDGNPLRTIPKGVFDSLSSLRVLSLSGCELDELSAAYFGSLKQLRRLDISRNHLRSLPSPFNLPALESLDASNNLLTKIGNTTFRSMISLRTLNVSENRLAEIHSHSFAELTNLRVLDLSKNELNSLTSSEWRLPSLESLNVSGNRLIQLQTASIVDLPKLKQLDLSSNHKLTTIQLNALVGVDALEWLSLSDCSLSSLSSSIFSPLPTQVVFFSLAENPLLCDCGVASLLSLSPSLDGECFSSSKNLRVPLSSLSDCSSWLHLLSSPSPLLLLLLFLFLTLCVSALFWLLLLRRGSHRRQKLRLPRSPPPLGNCVPSHAPMLPSPAHYTAGPSHCCSAVSSSYMAASRASSGSCEYESPRTRHSSLNPTYSEIAPFGCSHAPSLPLPSSQPLLLSNVPSSTAICPPSPPVPPALSNALSLAVRSTPHSPPSLPLPSPPLRYAPPTLPPPCPPSYS